MACGVPSVATRAGGVPEFVVDGETGLLVEPGDVEAMAQAVEKLIGSESLKKKMVTAAAEKFSSSFTTDLHVQQMLKLYGLMTSR
jgi:glycosyltransferase involved in cell wall biosynthesis